MCDILRRRVATGRELDVLGQVDDHGSGTARACDIERFVDDSTEVIGVADEIIVLGTRSRDADGVRLLKRIIADQMGRDLTGQTNDRYRVHHRIGQSGHGVGRAGTRGHQQHADLAGGTRIAFGGVNCAGFVANQNVPQLVLTEYDVVDRQHGAAGVAENYVHTLVDQRANDDLGAG